MGVRPEATRAKRAAAALAASPSGNIATTTDSYTDSPPLFAPRRFGAWVEI